VHAIEVLLSQHWRSFAVTDIPEGSDQFRDFVRVLESRQFNLDDRVGIAKEDFGGGLNDAGLAGSRRTQKPAIVPMGGWRVHAGKKIWSNHSCDERPVLSTMRAVSLSSNSCARGLF